MNFNFYKRKGRKRMLASSLSTLNVDIQRLIQRLGHVFSILLPLPHAFGQQVLDLPVGRAEIVLRPGRNLVVQLCRQPQENLFFLSIRHINTGFPRSQWVARRDCRTTPPADWIPWPRGAPRPGTPPCFARAVRGPFPPCPPRRQQSFCARQ